MSNDIELLEFAAKAAGVEIKDSNRWADTIVRKVTLDDGSMNFVRWNPLTDDGDALRLAVALNLNIEHYPRSGERWAVLENIQRCAQDQAHDNDPCATTRRAIVRAAAEIGRNMK